jgi:hypothetical protein
MTKNGTKLYKVTTGRGADKNTLAVCTSQKEADATASTYQRNGCWDVAVTTEKLDDKD